MKHGCVIRFFIFCIIAAGRSGEAWGKMGRGGLTAHR